MTSWLFCLFEVIANIPLMISLTEMEAQPLFSGVIVMDWTKRQQTMPRSAGRAGFAGPASLLVCPLGTQRCQRANSLSSNPHRSVRQLIITLSDQDVAQVCRKSVESWRASGCSDDSYIHAGEDLQQEVPTQRQDKISLELWMIQVCFSRLFPIKILDFEMDKWVK